VHQIDLLKLRSCPVAQVEAWAESLGVREVGVHKTYWIRREHTHPLTRERRACKRSLGIRAPDLRRAVLAAVEVWEKFLLEFESPLAPRAEERAGTICTLDELKAAYEAAAHVKAREARTRTRNFNEVMNILEGGLGRKVGGHESAALLTFDVAERWQAGRHKAAMAETDFLKRETMLRSANGTLRQARGVFTDTALADMRRLVLPLEQIRAFRKLPMLPAKKKAAPVQLTEAEVVRILGAVELLRERVVEYQVSAGVTKRVPGVAVWAAFTVMIESGARNGEVRHARLSWLRESAEAPGLWELQLIATKEWKGPKGGERVVGLFAPTVERLRALSRVAGDDFIVPARTATERREICERAINTWLKAEGIERDGNAVAYRLRRYYLKRQEAQARLHLAAAMHAARTAGHANVTTTHAYIGRPDVITPITMPAAAVR